jgi:hypothetical protein
LKHEGQAGEVAGHVGVADPRVQRLLQLTRPPLHLDERLGGVRLYARVRARRSRASGSLPRASATARSASASAIAKVAASALVPGVPAWMGPAGRCLWRAAAAVLGAGGLGGECQRRGDGERDDDAGW